MYKDETEEERTFRYLWRCPYSDLSGHYFYEIGELLKVYPKDRKFPFERFMNDEDYHLSIREEDIKAAGWCDVLEYTHHFFWKYGWTIEEVAVAGLDRDCDDEYYLTKISWLWMKDQDGLLPFYDEEDDKWYWSRRGAEDFYSVHGYYPDNILEDEV